jgi:hypothetical protein
MSSASKIVDALEDVESLAAGLTGYDAGQIPDASDLCNALRKLAEAVRLVAVDTVLEFKDEDDHRDCVESLQLDVELLKRELAESRADALRCKEQTEGLKSQLTRWAAGKPAPSGVTPRKGSKRTR